MNNEAKRFNGRTVEEVYKRVGRKIKGGFERIKKEKPED